MKQLTAILFLIAFAVAQIHPAMDAIKGCKHSMVAKAKSCCSAHQRDQHKKTSHDDCCNDDCNPFTGNCGKCGVDVAVTSITGIEMYAVNWKANKYYPVNATCLVDFTSDRTQPPEIS